MSVTQRRWSPRLRYRAASDYLKEVHGLDLAPKTLMNRCCEGIGPEVEYFDATPYLTPTALDAWVEGRLGDTRRPNPKRPSKRKGGTSNPAHVRGGKSPARAA